MLKTIQELIEAVEMGLGGAIDTCDEVMVAWCDEHCISYEYDEVYEYGTWHFEQCDIDEEVPDFE